MEKQWTEDRDQLGGHRSDFGNKGGGLTRGRAAVRKGAGGGPRRLGERASRTQQPGSVQRQRGRWPVNGAPNKQGNVISNQEKEKL